MNEPKETAIPKSNRDDRHIEISGIDFQLLRWQKRRMLMFSRDTNTRAVKGFTVCTNPEHVPAATEEKDG